MLSSDHISIIIAIYKVVKRVYKNFENILHRLFLFLGQVLYALPGDQDSGELVL